MAMITIVLATYNSEKYIRPQIDSILHQDHRDIRLVISDDGSTDATAEIINEYRDKYPEIIMIEHSGRRFGGPSAHFLYLLDRYADSDYLMFSDHDDVWHTDKVSKTLSAMQKAEQLNHDMPVLVYSDLRVVDGELNEICSSLMKYDGVNPNRNDLNHLLIQNVVSGCTAMLNSSLLSVIKGKIPENGIMMHDRFVAIMAAATGKLVYVDEPLIEYRQHGGNAEGAKGFGTKGFVNEKLKGGHARNNIFASFKQADAIAKCYADRISEEKLEIIRIYASLGNKNRFMRKVFYIKFGFWKSGAARIIGQLFIG